MWRIIPSNTDEFIVTSLMFARDVIVVKEYYFGGLRSRYWFAKLLQHNERTLFFYEKNASTVFG